MRAARERAERRTGQKRDAFSAFSHSLARGPLRATTAAVEWPRGRKSGGRAGGRRDKETDERTRGLSVGRRARGFNTLDGSNAPFKTEGKSKNPSSRAKSHFDQTRLKPRRAVKNLRRKMGRFSLLWLSRARIWHATSRFSLTSVQVGACAMTGHAVAR